MRLNQTISAINNFVLTTRSPRLTIMKVVLFTLFFGIALTSMCQGASQTVQENYLESPLYDCVRCLCHAVSGCWRRQNCARYSISRNYWQEAGGLTVSGFKSSKGSDGYSSCIRDENCIVGTIIRYTEKYGKLDCNCDGKFDCKDRAAIHLFGQRCENPKFNNLYANRFNDCSRRVGVPNMLPVEGDESCKAPPAE